MSQQSIIKIENGSYLKKLMMNFDKNPIGILNKQQQKSNDLPTTVEITVGMKVMVPVKVATQNFQIKVREVNRKYITQSDY